MVFEHNFINSVPILSFDKSAPNLTLKIIKIGSFLDEILEMAAKWPEGIYEWHFLKSKTSELFWKFEVI
jgi:hypothetical protein